ncbi:MAG: hypothetical protein WA517_09115 [Candidatus Acidiferrum sp.]
MTSIRAGRRATADSTIEQARHDLTQQIRRRCDCRWESLYLYGQLRQRYSVCMKLRPPQPGEYLYAVAIRDGSDLWLALWVRRSPKGEFFVMVPRAERDWTPHASYHLDGTHHMKSYGQKTVRRHGQALTGVFTGTENLGCFAGHGTNLAECDQVLFHGVLEVPIGVLRAHHGTICIDLVEPGCQPITAIPSHKVVRRKTFTDILPHVVITIYSPRQGTGARNNRF